MLALNFTSLPSTTPRPCCASFKTTSLASAFSGIRLGSEGPRGRMVMVRMGKRETEMAEIRGKSTEQLQEEVVDLKGEILMQKLLWSARKDFDQGSFRRMRKQIARMMTVKRERELEEGIGKRLSRKLDKKWKRSIVPRPPPSLRKMLEESKAGEENKST